MLIKELNENYMRYKTTSQEIFETFFISKAHKKYLKIDENKKTIYFNYPEKNVEINYEPVKSYFRIRFLREIGRAHV